MRLKEMFSGGDRRSIGAVGQVVALVLTHSERNGELVELLWDSDAVVRMRAADALEKISRERAEWVEPYKAELLGLMAEAEQQEVRWHLAGIVPRLGLTSAERLRAVEILWKYLEDRSSIVKTCAMQGIWDVAEEDAGMREAAVELVFAVVRAHRDAPVEVGDVRFTVTAAMQARGRRLLKERARQGGEFASSIRKFSTGKRLREN